MKDLRKFVSTVFLFCLLLSLAGCATGNKKSAASEYSLEVQKILLGEAILGKPYDPAELPHYDLFEVTPEMVAFAQKVTRSADDYFEKVRALHVALLSSREAGGYGISYSAYTTEVPKVTFATRRANCLSFTLLYVALARQVGINAYVNEVQIPPTWDLRNKNDMVFLRHVNVKVPMRGRNLTSIGTDDVVIDLEMNRYSAAYTQYEIGEDLVAAEFYSNRAMEYLEAKDNRSSFLHLRKALAMNDQQSYIWSNLGTLYGRNKLYHEAEIAYRHGLQVNPDDFTIMNNLAYILQQMGNPVDSAKYLKLAQRYRESNPYHQYNLAVAAYENKRYDEALAYVRRALNKEKKEIRFYELAARIYEQTGDQARLKDMQKQIKKLRPLSPVMAR